MESARVIVCIPRKILCMRTRKITSSEPHQHHTLLSVKRTRFRDRDRVNAIAARQIQSTDTNQKYHALYYHFEAENVVNAQNRRDTETYAQHTHRRSMRSVCTDCNSWMQRELVHKRREKRQNRAKRKWFMTFHMKQNTHSNAFLFDAHELTLYNNTNIFMRSRIFVAHSSNYTIYEIGRMKRNECTILPKNERKKKWNGFSNSSVCDLCILSGDDRMLWCRRWRKCNVCSSHLFISVLSRAHSRTTNKHK